MEKLVINGGKKLSGEVQISGAKNAVLPIMAAALLQNGTCIINNVPHLKDVLVMLSIFSDLGVKHKFSGSKLVLDCSKVQPNQVDVCKLLEIRGSNLILGSLLGRFGEVEFSSAGGCSIGSRPMDLHFAAFSALGAEVFGLGSSNYIFANKLVGGEIDLSFASVGATENAIMAAVLAEGVTVIRNAACEPEIVDLGNFINKMGGKVSGAGTSVVTVFGVEKLSPVEYKVMPDRIETGTFVLAAALAGENVEIWDCRPSDNESLLNFLVKAGISMDISENKIVVHNNISDVNNVFNDVIDDVLKSEDLPLNELENLPFYEIETAPYPEFPTDMQSQMLVFLARANCRFQLTENIFENRFQVVKELAKMSVAISVVENVAFGFGGQEILAAEVFATDLRAGAALVLAALVAVGRSEVGNVCYIERGYENLCGKLQNLGADIKVVGKVGVRGGRCAIGGGVGDDLAV